MAENQTIKKRRRVNGDGSVYKRKDGYWAGAVDVPTTSGARKRVVVYGKTLAEAREKLAKVQQDVRSGVPVPDKVWKLGPYLDYWLENFVKRNRRPATYNLYEMIVRLYLKPGLGSRKLTSLTVPMIQEFLNQRLQKGRLHSQGASHAHRAQRRAHPRGSRRTRLAQRCPPGRAAAVTARHDPAMGRRRSACLSRCRQA